MHGKGTPIQQLGIIHVKQTIVKREKLEFDIMNDHVYKVYCHS